MQLERNLKIFNHMNPGYNTSQRANQAGLDVRAHLESASHREGQENTNSIAPIIAFLCAKYPVYDKILTIQLF